MTISRRYASAAALLGLVLLLSAPAARAQSDTALQAELVYWETVSASENAEMYRAYLNKYPEGRFADLARIKATELESGVPAASAGTESAQPAPAVSSRNLQGRSGLDPSRIRVKINADHYETIEDVIEALNKNGRKKGLAFVSDSEWDLEIDIGKRGAQAYSPARAFVEVRSRDGRLAFSVSKAGRMYQKSNAVKRSIEKAVERIALYVRQGQ